MKNNFNLLKPCFGTTYIRHINGLYLAIKNNKACLTTEKYLWILQSFENDRFYLKNISDHDCLEYFCNNLNTAIDSGYTVQHWHIYIDNNNHIIIEHADSKNMFLCSDNNNLSIKNINSNKDDFLFFLENNSLTDGYPYIETLSKTKRISLRVEPSILNIVNKEWLKEWTDDLEKAVYSFSRLVGHLPFPTIEIRGYTNCNAWGYIYYNIPVVHINNGYMKNEIIRMRQRKTRDISFGTLHEISHLFDKPVWLFDGEAMANIKIPYVLKELDFTVQVNENSNERLFTLENYVEDLYSSQGKLDNVKGLFSSSLAAKITEIAIIIGYDAFKETFRSINILHESNLKRFELFIEKLSEYSSKNIKEMFTNEEWNTIVKNLS